MNYKNNSADFLPRDARHGRILTPMKRKTFITMEKMLEDSGKLNPQGSVVLKNDSGPVLNRPQEMTVSQLVMNHLRRQGVNKEKLKARFKLLDIYKKEEGAPEREPVVRRLLRLMDSQNDTDDQNECESSKSYSRASKYSMESNEQF